MAVPGSREARLFYRCAFQRLGEAEVLLEYRLTTGAVYLAGYGIECILKALVLMAVPAGFRSETSNSFRGNRGHDLEWLRTLYLTNGGAQFPREIRQHFILVSSWSTDLRYSPRSVRADEAEAYVESTAAIIKWADGRL